MKKTLIILLIAAGLSSCSIQHHRCPAYTLNNSTDDTTKA